MWTYTWDGRGYLTGMTRKAGTSADSTVATEALGFGYDGDGRRTSKVRTLTYTSGSPRVESSRMLWDGWLPVMEERTVNGAGLTRRWYVWGRDVSGGLDGAGGIGGLVAIQEEGGRTLYPVEDGLGNITAVVNAANGATVARYDYGPYGEVAGESGEKDACPFRYQSKYYDSETELSYFGYRYYSAKLGRWLSRDPLGEAGGFNLYAYCQNDPVNGHDLLGMDPFTDAQKEQLIMADVLGNVSLIQESLGQLDRSDPFFAMGYRFGGVNSAHKFGEGMNRSVGFAASIPIGIVAAPFKFGANVYRVYQDDGTLDAASFALYSWNIGMVAEAWYGVDYFGEPIGLDDARGDSLDVAARLMHGGSGLMAFIPAAKGVSSLTLKTAGLTNSFARNSLSYTQRIPWRLDFSRGSLGYVNLGGGGWPIKMIPRIFKTNVAPKIITEVGAAGTFTTAEFGNAIVNNPIASHAYAAMQKNGIDVSLYSMLDDFAGSAGNGQVGINLAYNTTLNDALSTLIHEGRHVRLQANTGKLYGLRSIRSGEYSARSLEFFFRNGRRPNIIERTAIQQEIIKLEY